MTGRDPESQGRGTTLAIADDHAIVREGLQLILRAHDDISVVGEACDVAGVLALLEALQPDVLLLDINLGTESALAAFAEIQAASPRTAVLILTMQNDAATAKRALAAGAAGYILKESPGNDLVRAVRTVAGGGTYLEPELGAELVRQRTEGTDDPLSAREREVLALLALGHTNAEVAKALFLSVRTVESHRARIHEKLGASGRSELVRYARRHGLVDP